MALRRGLSALHALLLPPTCLMCGAPGQVRLPALAWRGPLDLCAACQADLPRSPMGQSAIPGFDRVCCPWAYRWPVDQFVRALKFAGERSHARLFGTLLALERQALGAPWPQLLVPVPLHPLRLSERGYNQAAELGRFAGRASGVPVRAQALERVRATREQSGLGATGRAANVAGAFRARVPLAGLHVALLDDVVTTGSTAAAAVDALRVAGAGPVELWAVARALRRRDAPDAATTGAQWPDV